MQETLGCNKRTVDCTDHCRTMAILHIVTKNSSLPHSSRAFRLPIKLLVPEGKSSLGFSHVSLSLCYWCERFAATA